MFNNGVCSACEVEEEYQALTQDYWNEKKLQFGDILNSYRDSGSNYDCIIAVSGGKDSYWQTYIINKI